MLSSLGWYLPYCSNSPAGMLKPDQPPMKKHCRSTENQVNTITKSNNKKYKKNKTKQNKLEYCRVDEKYKNDSNPTEPIAEIKRFRFCIKVDSQLNKNLEAKVSWDKALNDMIIEDEFRMFSEANLRVTDTVNVSFMQAPKCIGGLEIPENY